MSATLAQASGTTTKPASPTFHIAFCVDNHYFRSMGATITSVIENNPGVHFTFHVFAFAVSDDHRRRLKELESKFNVSTQLHIVDADAFKEFKHFIEFSYYSLSIFSRLIIPTVLRGVTDRVLYLDADILCVGKIDELIEMDISNDIAVVVPDAPVTTSRRCAALNLKHPRYFNGGVLFMNVENWIKNKITEQAMQTLLDEGKKLRFNDQDALNIVLDGRARFIDTKYNFLYDLIYDLDRGNRQMRPVDDAVFIHFAGAVKPWADWSGHDSRAMFIKYHALSPWADMPLDPAPRNSREMRMRSRFLMKRGQIVGGLRWYFKYLKARSR
jgi:UDP-glucose:(glucosyl)LPS alpha-1,3-glucosyltransferase